MSRTKRVKTDQPGKTWKVKQVNVAAKAMSASVNNMKQESQGTIDALRDKIQDLKDNSIPIGPGVINNSPPPGPGNINSNPPAGPGAPNSPAPNGPNIRMPMYYDFSKWIGAVYFSYYMAPIWRKIRIALVVALWVLLVAFVLRGNNPARIVMSTYTDSIAQIPHEIRTEYVTNYIDYQWLVDIYAALDYSDYWAYFMHTKTELPSGKYALGVTARDFVEHYDNEVVQLCYEENEGFFMVIDLYLIGLITMFCVVLMKWAIYGVDLNYHHQIRVVKVRISDDKDRRPDTLAQGNILHKHQYLMDVEITDWSQWIPFCRSPVKRLVVDMELLTQLLSHPVCAPNVDGETTFNKMCQVARTLHTLNEDRSRAIENKDVQLVRTNSCVVAYMLYTWEMDKIASLPFPKPQRK